MGEGGEDSETPDFTGPRIVSLGSNWRELDSISGEGRTRNLASKDFKEISIDASDWPFEINQKSDFVVIESGLLEITVLQEESTPGIRTKMPITLSSGRYILTVVAYADVESTFFPWIIDSEGVRLTPTVHIPISEEPISVRFNIVKETEIFFGVLSHRQEEGDKCYVSSFHISKEESLPILASKGNFTSVKREDFIPHQSSTIEFLEEGTLIRSKPLSTPGAYSLIDVEPSSMVTIFVKASVVFPSVAFLYIADSISGKELIKRDIIFESKENSSSGEPTEIFSSFEIPSETSRIRVGILFSTVSTPEEHQMTIHNIEISKFHSLNNVVGRSYVLSLKEDFDKFELCKRQAWRHDIDIHRWEATNGESPEIYSDWMEYMESPWNNLDQTLGRKSIDKPGAWGYLLTMKSIFQHAMKNDFESIAVFDDDFILSKSFDHGFSKLIEILGDSWDVIYLGASQWLWDELPAKGAPFYQPDENTNGSFAVIYKRAVFQEILDGIEKMSAPFDAGPLREVVLGKSSTRSFVALPNLVIANLEKPGIRDSRNQIEFSKRFGWELESFPSCFTSWSSKPSLVRETKRENEEEPLNFITAVTTIDRIEYLQQFASDWKETKSSKAKTTLVIADDGSSDGTLEWLIDDLESDESNIVVIRNDGLGIARQTNSILDYILSSDLNPDAIFMCNDDIRFLKPGWDEEYHTAMLESGFDHLVYFNSEWKSPTHATGSPRSNNLFSHCSAREAMGCFYTLTPRLIEKLGFFDEKEFPVRGHSHVDYTIRACRAEANDLQYLYDFRDSNKFIGMVMRDGYKRTHRTLSVFERKISTSPESLARREQVLLTEGRIFIPRGW